MVIINSRQDQAKRIGYIYAAILLMFAIIMNLIGVTLSSIFPWVISIALLALYSITAIPKRADGSRTFYEANQKKFAAQMDLKAIGPAIKKEKGRNNCMGALILTGKELQFRPLTLEGIAAAPLHTIDLMSFGQITKKIGDIIVIKTPQATYSFMVNKPSVWMEQIYKARQ